MRNSYLILLFLALSLGATAQDSNVWTLERAVEHALKNNLQVRQRNTLADVSKLDVQQALNNRLPTLSGSTNFGRQFGRTIDPTTNEFEQQAISFQRYSLNANVTLYGGGFIKNSIRQAELDAGAAELDAKVTSNNVALQVANSYLTVVLAREQLANARAQLELTTEQLNNTNALIDAGALPPAERFDLQAQVAANQRTVVELENQVTMALLNLKLQLLLEPNAEFDVATPQIDPTDAQLFQEYNAEEVLFSARNIQPTIAAAEMRRESVGVGEAIAKAGMRPTLSLFGNVNTNFSSIARDFTQPGFPRQSYFSQLDQNFGQSVGVQLQVPIYDRNRNKINVQRAKMQMKNADLDVEQAENQLVNDVQLALTDLRAARQTFRAAEISLEAAQIAYENAQKSYKAGASNSLDLVTATNRLDQARTEYTRSKYQLIFNRQVIQFYLGRGLSLD
jgi:outer membrane protein